MLTPEVAMSSVTIEGNPANKTMEEKAAVWTARVDLTGKQTVRIEAKSAGGVTATGSFDVSNPPRENERVGPLEIPAEFEVTVVSKNALASVQVDGQAIPVENGKAVWRGNVGKRDVAFQATNGKNQATDQLLAEPGVRKSVTLTVDPTATFVITSADGTALPNATAKFGQEVMFDASGASPSNIKDLVWDFGDGTRHRGSERKLVHTYSLARATNPRETYTVSLKVCTAQGESDPFTREFQVVANPTSLELGVQTFPASAPVFRPNERVLFRIAGRPGSVPAEISGITIDFGDGHTTTVDDSKQSIAASMGARSKPVIVSHAYAKPGRFRPKATYTHDSPALRGPFDAKLHFGDSVDPDLIVTPAPAGDSRLAEQAWGEVLERLVETLRSVEEKWPADVANTGVPTGKVKRPSIALTALRDANFEHTDAHEARIIERMMTGLVDHGYIVLERRASALARLAPESVVDIRHELESANQVGNGTKTHHAYRDHLDYGIRAKHSPEQPIMYSIALEGTADRVTKITEMSTKFDKSTEATSSAETRQQGQAAKNAPEEREKTTQRDAWEALKNMPLLVARFQTARLVIAFECLSGKAPNAVMDCDFSISARDHYDAALDLPMDRRVATARVNVRILDRTGAILRAVQIRGQGSELVPVLSATGSAARF